MALQLSKITLQRICYFQDLIKHGSLASAAKALDIPIANLSREIKILEESLGTQLKAKDKRVLTLTEDGKKFATFSSIVLNELDQCNFGGVEKSDQELSIATTYGISEIYLPNIINEFHEEFPRIKINIKSGEQYLQFTDHSIDIVIGQLLPQRPDLSQKHLMKFKYYFFASKGYFCKRKIEARPLDLGKLDFVLYDKDKARYEKKFENIHCIAESNSYRALLELGNLGVGAFPFSSHALRKIDPEGQKYIQIITDPCEEEDIYFIYSKHSPKLMMINKFQKIVHKHLKE